MLTIIDSYDISSLNTFRMKVKAKQWIRFESLEDLRTAFGFVGSNRFRCIGQGSNLLFTKDFDGVLLNSGILTLESYFEGDSVVIKVGSGIVFDTLVEMTTNAGFWGLENLSYIPGGVGAAAVQNIGAYGVEIKDYIESVECYDSLTDSVVTFDNASCAYGYRDSFFKRKEARERYIVTELTLRLPRDGKPNLGYGNLSSAFDDIDNVTPADVREAVIAMRRSKLPEVSEIGSAGSFFKNPVISISEFEEVKSKAAQLGIDIKQMPHYIVNDNQIKVPAAWLIDNSGCKNFSVGGASIWQKQPLVIVNSSGKASPDDILSLEAKVIDTVNDTFGVTLEPEVDHIC